MNNEVLSHKERLINIIEQHPIYVENAKSLTGVKYDVYQVYSEEDQKLYRFWLRLHYVNSILRSDKQLTQEELNKLIFTVANITSDYVMWKLESL